MNEELTTQGQTPTDSAPQEPQDVQTPVDAQLTTDQAPGDDQAPQAGSDIDQKFQNDMMSWAGRKIKEGIDAGIGSAKKEFADVVADILNQQNIPAPGQPMPGQPQFQQPQQPYVDIDPEPDPDVDVRQWYEWRKRQDQIQETQSRQMADNTYFQALEMPDIKHPDQKVHTAVLEDMKANQGHSMVTGNPAADAALNYAKALQRVTNKMIPTPQNPLANNPPPGPGLGTTTPSSDGQHNVASMPKLSPAAAKIVARGMADSATSKNWTGAAVRKRLGIK